MQLLHQLLVSLCLCIGQTMVGFNEQLQQQEWPSNKGMLCTGSCVDKRAG
jgi:hypothetical protein